MLSNHLVNRLNKSKVQKQRKCADKTNKTRCFSTAANNVLTCEEEEHEDHDHGVSKVEDRAGHSDYLQL